VPSARMLPCPTDPVGQQGCHLYSQEESTSPAVITKSSGVPPEMAGKQVLVPPKFIPYIIMRKGFTCSTTAPSHIPSPNQLCSHVCPQTPFDRSAQAAQAQFPPSHLRHPHRLSGPRTHQQRTSLSDPSPSLPLRSALLPLPTKPASLFLARR
jgi:hypothetical protein